MTMIDGNRALRYLEELIRDTKEFPKHDFVEGAIYGLETAKNAIEVLNDQEDSNNERKRALLDMFTKIEG